MGSSVVLNTLTFIAWTEFFFKTSSFMLLRRKKVRQVWNDIRVSK